MLKKLFTGLLLFTLVTTFSASAQQATGDPWIKQVYQQVYLRPPSAWEYNINNYNNGSWNNYGDLLAYVVQYQNSLKSEGYIVKTTSIGNNQSAAIFYKNGTPEAGALISNIAGSLVGKDGTSLIGNDAAGLIGLDNATLKSLATVSFADASTKFAQSAGIKYLKASGKGRIVFKKR